MSKDAINQYDATAANNTDVGGISIDEGMLPSNVNNALREIMSHLKDVDAGTSSLTSPVISGDLLTGTDTGDAFNAHAKLRVQKADHAYLQIKSANTKQAGVLLGDTDDDFVGGMIYDNSTNHLQFNSGDAERMRIDSSGNVGIGTTTPSSFGGNLVASGTGSIINARSSSGTSAIGLWEGSSSRFFLTTLNGSDGLAFVDGDGSSKRMTILSNGHVLINRDSEIGTTFFNIGGVSASVNGIGVQNGADSTTVFSFFIRNASAVTIGSISNNGSTTSFNTTSDYRLKENVTDITDGITRLKLLNPSRFNFIADADTTVDGFLAHEVSDIVPEAITGEKDAMMDEEYEVTPAVLDDDGNVVTDAVMGTRSVPSYQGIDQSKLVPLLTAALQEAVAKIEALETRVAALEA